MIDDKRLCTPAEYVALVKRLFGEVDLDPCGNEHSVVGALREYRPPTDGLKEPWFGRVYVNPPWGYDWKHSGTNLSAWLWRCGMEMTAGAADEVIVFVPYAPRAKWWRDNVHTAHTAEYYPLAMCVVAEPLVEFIKHGESSGPIDCAFLYYGNRAGRFCEVFRGLGPTWLRR